MARLNDILFHFLIFCVLAISVWTFSGEFTDSYILPKWLFTLVSVLLGIAWYAAGMLWNRAPRIRTLYIGGSIVAVCGAQAVYGILQYAGLLPSPSLYPVVGSFDNPAGFASCLSIGLPFVGVLLSDDKRYIRYAGWMSAMLIAVAVVLSASRAGIVSIAVMGAVWLFKRLDGTYRAGRYVLLTAGTLLFAGCYLMKKDSADGRLLIWRCSVEMAKKAPLFGHGSGSFEAHYMDAQADYFRSHGTESRYAMLADNVKHPFNEYLSLLLNFGLAGWAALACVAVWLVRCYRKRLCREKRIAAYALLSVGTFSLFSYPFTYPFTWIVTLLCVVTLAREPIQRIFDLSKMKYATGVVGLVGSLVCMYLWAERVRAEWDWNEASRLVLAGKYEKALPEYQKLSEKFADNPYFLYNYAAVLQEGGRYVESQAVGLQCRRHWADYDLELILGGNCRRLKRFDEAEAHYRLASQMCPSRFLPLYELLHLYKERGDTRRLREVADEMAAKPMKRKTPAILMMRREAEREKEKAEETNRKDK